MCSFITRISFIILLLHINADVPTRLHPLPTPEASLRAQQLMFFSTMDADTLGDGVKGHVAAHLVKPSRLAASCQRQKRREDAAEAVCEVGVTHERHQGLLSQLQLRLRTTKLRSETRQGTISRMPCLPSPIISLSGKTPRLRIARSLQCHLKDLAATSNTASRHRLRAMRKWRAGG
ncbi:unnamed protein product [Prorocentrum cordatum]|uniref:Secreted protein n=1 Tax=Prorocentrum cordatum TaxID=2364126 RepID=A0ABN9QMH5_9DINO|nr:unnamed protein product [Polarella glacialis]